MQTPEEANYDRFLAWEKQVDQEVIALVGCSLYDLPDCPTRDWFEAGVKPKAAAKRATRVLKGVRIV